MRFALFTSCITAVLCAGLLTLMGIDRQTEKHGLNPALAFPMAGVSLLLARAAFRCSSTH